MELPPVTQQYVDMITQGHAPWMEGKNSPQWSDSTKQQFFEIFNTELANEMELERWRLNNEYNTPKAQMQRMIEAGINPAAAYQSISSGNASSAPDSHVAGAAPFHDTSDKLQRINTIMSGITSIMSTINQGIDAVAGIQGITYNAQDRWYNNLRYEAYKEMGIPTIYPESAFVDGRISKDAMIEVAPGLYAQSNDMMMFPEFFESFGFSSRDSRTRQAAQDIQQQLADRRTRIDQLIQSLFNGLENNASNAEMIRLFMELFAYGAMSKFGGF